MTLVRRNWAGRLFAMAVATVAAFHAPLLLMRLSDWPFPTNRYSGMYEATQTLLVVCLALAGIGCAGFVICASSDRRPSRAFAWAAFGAIVLVMLHPLLVSRIRE